MNSDAKSAVDRFIAEAKEQRIRTVHFEHYATPTGLEWFGLSFEASANTALSYSWQIHPGDPAPDVAEFAAAIAGAGLTLHRGRTLRPDQLAQGFRDISGQRI